MKNRKNKMSYTGYEKFQKSILKSATKLIKLKKTDKKLIQAFKNTMFDLNGPKIMEKKIPENEKIFAKFLYSFAEIFDSYENLLNCIVYIRQYPNYRSFKKHGITKTKYLHYHIEKYLEEVYMLRERLLTYVNITKKYFKKKQKILDEFKRLVEIILKSFEGIVQTRGSHIHVRRYCDNNFDRLKLLDLVSPDIPALKTYRDRLAYPQIRKKWLSEIKVNNKTIKELLDVYFDLLYPLIFDSKGNFKIKQ